MSEDGYTLLEMLAALMIIGLAFSGLSESAQVLGRMQSDAGRTANRARSGASVQRAMSRLMIDRGPFLSTSAERFSGGPGQFTFDCGAGQCGARVQRTGAVARLVISREGGLVSSEAISPGAHFVYVDAQGPAAFWPATVGPPEALRSISLVDDAKNGFPVATVKLSIDEAPGCVFDIVAQACRAAG